MVIWKVDRLARRVLDFLHADETLQKRGAGLVAVEDPIDMTSEQGRAFAVMLAVFREMEAEVIRARVPAVRAQLIKDGRVVGGGIPYGYLSTAKPDGPGRVLESATPGVRGKSVVQVNPWRTRASCREVTCCHAGSGSIIDSAQRQ